VLPKNVWTCAFGFDGFDEKICLMVKDLDAKKTEMNRTRIST
jgi:hypothetical protein